MVCTFIYVLIGLQELTGVRCGIFLFLKGCSSGQLDTRLVLCVLPLALAEFTYPNHSPFAFVFSRLSFDLLARYLLRYLRYTLLFLHTFYLVFKSFFSDTLLTITYLLLTFHNTAV